ncbi:MAG: DUF559 domain-containing protein [Planctomycetes bacterium]|nr:DUF559 domain-containing protein [Planctomycetota bacterium]
MMGGWATTEREAVAHFPAEGHRCKAMASIRSAGNRSTERRLRALLALSGCRGWTVRPPNIQGRPDFAFRREKFAIFADGCFWHSCPKCRIRLPAWREYWHPKLLGNKRRDARVTAALRREGWLVLRIWEHDIMRSPQKVMRRVLSSVSRRRRTAVGRSLASVSSATGEPTLPASEASHGNQQEDTVRRTG